VVHPSPVLFESHRPLRRVEFDRLVDLGAFEDERVELLAGVLVEMSPQGVEHAGVSALLAEILILALSGRARVRSHSPLSLSNESEPEPDVAVVPLGDYRRAHPTAAHLVIEVADSSLRKDREIKTQLYADAGIPEYWLVDWGARVIEVHRTPARGARYSDVRVVARGETLSPLAFADVHVDVDALFPGTATGG
jgi:Uma2 family endonuclease